MTPRAILFSLSLLAIGCANESPPIVQSGELVFVAGDACRPLYAGRNIEVGQLCVSIDDTANTVDSCGGRSLGALVLTFTTFDGWTMTEVHADGGDSLEDIPTNRAGNPQPGRFRFTASGLDTTSYSVAIPLCDFGLDSRLETCDDVTAYLAAHAVVRQGEAGESETAWADGARFSRSSWAEYFTTTLVCGSSTYEPPTTGTETAWAFGGDLAIDFRGAPLDLGRWGWTNGPLDEGRYEFELWAGAGSGLESGTLVGTLDVDYADGTVTATFVATGGTDFTFDETHLYAGSALLPSDHRGYTAAPGQLGHTHGELGGATVDTFTVSGLSGPIYLAAHAVVRSSLFSGDTDEDNLSE